jgi:two-component system chemotaxis response regulator CheY
MPRTVLIVEDSASMRELLVHAVGRVADVEVITADNGLAAIQVLSTEQPDLIMVDINMPVLDGFKLIERVRADKVLGKIPIVVISTEEGEEDRERATALGATAYLVKPVRSPDIVELVTGLLALR